MKENELSNLNFSRFNKTSLYSKIMLLSTESTDSRIIRLNLFPLFCLPSQGMNLYECVMEQGNRFFRILYFDFLNMFLSQLKLHARVTIDIYQEGILYALVIVWPYVHISHVKH